MVILRHGPGEGQEFFTLYGHLTKESLTKLRVGQAIARGERIGRVGAVQENGGWPPHLHFQVIVDLLDRGTDFPGVALAAERGVWTDLSPDPNLLLGITGERLVVEEKDAAETLAARKNLLGRNLSVSYQRPLKIVRGWKQYLYDETGRAYLDVYNNVPLVGHSHPRVVRAAQEQLGAAQYQHALSARQRDPLRGAAYGAFAGTAARLLFPEFRQRGERTGACDSRARTRAAKT